MKELKEILQVDGSTHLNIFFANSSDEELAGVATWPWDKEALTHLGRKQKHARMQAHTLARTLTCTRVYSSTFSRWNCAESFLLWHVWSHWHHGPRDRSQSWPLPRVSGHIGGGVVQRRVSGDWALDGNWRSVCRHQPHSQIQRLPRSGSRQWNLRVPGLHPHALQQLHELCWWAINQTFTP